MLWKWYDSKLVRVEQASPTVRRFWLELDEDAEEFTFEAGQFITLDLPISDKRTKRWRSYSIANVPGEDQLIELCIVNLEGGEGTTYLFEEIQIGDPVKFKGPSGTFTLPKEIDKDLIMVCTGTGVAPFRSMLHHIYNNQIPHKKIHLIYGTRYANNILYKEEFEDLEKKMENFKYSVALSREEYKGYQGYVHEIYKNVYGQPAPDRKFYLCGWSYMIDDAVENLILDLKYDKSQVLYELYD